MTEPTADKDQSHDLGTALLSYPSFLWKVLKEGTEGPPIWDVVSNYISKKKTITATAADNVKITGL